MAHPIPVVRIFVENDSGKILLLRRPGGAASGDLWCLPGGKVDYGETIEQAVRRELLEETSLVCEELQFQFYQDSLPAEPHGAHYINFYFEASTHGAIRLNKESDGYAWIGPADLRGYEIAFRNDLAMLRYWNKK